MIWALGYFIIGLINLALCGVNGWFDYYRSEDLHLEIPEWEAVFFEIALWPAVIPINVAHLFRRR